MDVEGFLDAEGTWTSGHQVPLFQTIVWGHTIEWLGSEANRKAKFKIGLTTIQ